MTTEFDYSVRVKNGAGWRRFNRVRLMISVGKDYHEGKKLVALVNWLNRNPEIQEVHISVNDLLQRHNYQAANMSADQATNVSLAEGALWIARNEDTLSDIKARKLFTRWQDWLDRPDFQPAYNALLSYARADALFENAMAKDAHSLAERKTKRGELVPASLVAHSQNYIEEEMAVFAVQSAALPAAEIYPGSNLMGADYLLRLHPTAKEELPEAIRSLAQRYFTRIDFDRINVVPSLSPAALATPRVA